MSASQQHAPQASIIGCIALTESAVRDWLLSADHAGAYPAWVRSLSKRELRQLVAEVQQILLDNGDLSRVFAAIGSARFKEYIKTECRAEIRRRSPRYARAHESLTTVVNEDGTEGYLREVVWPVHGKVLYRISDDHMRQHASPSDQADWPAIRKAAIARGRSVR
jgi:sirohydrochlorin ferrochelatase